MHVKEIKFSFKHWWLFKTKTSYLLYFSQIVQRWEKGVSGGKKNQYDNLNSQRDAAKEGLLLLFSNEEKNRKTCLHMATF